MGKTIKDYADQLGLSENSVKEKLKPDIFDFLQDKIDKPLVAVEHERIEILITKFIDTSAGHKFFKHDRTKNEWNHKPCLEDTVISSLSGLLRIWLKSKKKTAKRNDHRQQLNNPKPTFGNTWSRSSAVVGQDQQPSTPSSRASSPVRSFQAVNQRRLRLNAIDSVDPRADLPEIPYRKSQEEELVDLNELFRQRPQGRKALEKAAAEKAVPQVDQGEDETTFASMTPPEGSEECLRTPLRISTVAPQSGLLSPPTTSRKRQHEDTTTLVDEDDCIVITEEEVVAKRMKMKPTKTAMIAKDETSTMISRERAKDSPRMTERVSSPVTVKVNIPPLPTPTPRTPVTRPEPAASFPTPPDDATTAAMEINDEERKDAMPLVDDEMNLCHDDISIRSRDESLHYDRGSTEQLNQASTTILPQPHNAVQPEELHTERTSTQLPGEVALMPLAEQISHRSPPRSVVATASPVVTTGNHPYRTLSVPVQPQHIHASDIKTDHHCIDSKTAISETPFIILDWLHAYKKSKILMPHCNDPGCVRDQKLRDRREFLRELEDQAELEIQYLSRDFR